MFVRDGYTSGCNDHRPSVFASSQRDVSYSFFKPAEMNSNTNTTNEELNFKFLGLSRLKSRDLEWYFFGALDKKYGNSSRTNRATEQGYWKTTGKDRQVRWYNRIVGMKKTLVLYIGRAPHGERTNWVMHEYRLVDEELEKAGIAQDAYVLCRIFRKNGAGPKNGEQYGAPLIEEEWDENVLEENMLLPKGETEEEDTPS